MYKFRCKICNGDAYVEIGEVAIKGNRDRKTIPLCACAKCNYLFLPGAVAYARSPEKSIFSNLRAAFACAFRLLREKKRKEIHEQVGKNQLKPEARNRAITLPNNF